MQLPVQQSCARCEDISETSTATGRVFAWFPIDHALKKAESACRKAGLVVDASLEEMRLTLSIENGCLATMLGALEENLTSEEAKSTRVLFKEGKADPTMQDVAQVITLTQFAARVNSEWLIALLKESRLTSHFQPIVNCRDTTEIFAHEALLRGWGRDGSPISPGRIFDAARDADLLFQLDLAARRSAIERARFHALKSCLFINFTPTAIYDPACCLRSTVRAINEAQISPEQVVFEVIESDRTTNMEHLLSILAYYRKHGFRVALDDLGAGYSSLNLIHQLKPNFIKLDMELIRDVDKDEYKAMVATKLLEMAQSLDVETIAEGIETEGELAWAQSHGVTYVQGYLIAKPEEQPVSTFKRAA
ncbi:MAG: EAL domain-containing protein [Phycisphaerales bacterium]|nr:MAG: EAL domain-containing protein [Phycisphaerales bacterium]